MEELNEGALPKPSSTEYMREYMRKFRKEHADRYNQYHREYMRKFRKEQADRYNQYHKDYYQNNKERINTRRRERYRAKNGGNDGV